MPSISVVIGTYDRAAMVRQAVEAALAQTLAPFEIVVSDDASTDDTPGVLAELAAAHPSVRVLRRESNSGGVGNWNDAVAQARGGYIALCSDDDRFLPDHLEASAAYLHAHPEAGFVHSGFVDVIDANGAEQFLPRRLRAAEPLTISRRNLISYMTRYYDWPVHPSTIVMRREIWDRTGGFDPAYQLTDTDWFLRAVEISPGVYLPRRGVYNRRHAGNWSNRLGSARMQAEIFEIVDAAIGRLWSGRPARRAAWNAVWRANARLRLGLTLWQRLRGGHGEAACALWHGILQATGRRSPAGIERWGERVIRGWCERRSVDTRDARQRVSPL